MWNCLTDQSHVTVPPARIVTLVGLNVRASALTVALAGAPLGCVGGGGTAVGGTGVAALAWVGAKVGAVVAAVVAVAAGLAAEVVAATLGEAEAVELGLIADGVGLASDLLSEPPQATSAIAPMPMTRVASVFNRESPGGVSVTGRLRLLSYIPFYAPCRQGADGRWRVAAFVTPLAERAFPEEGPFQGCAARPLAAGDRERSSGGGGNDRDGAEDQPHAGGAVRLDLH